MDKNNSIIKFEDEYSSLNDLSNQKRDDLEQETNFTSLQPELTYKRSESEEVPYASRRQSAQMNTFVENFIKPKLPNQFSDSMSTIIPNVKLTKELMKRVSKKQTNFNLIIIGDQGLGKSTFIQAFVKNNINTGTKDEEMNMDGNNDIVERPFILISDGQKVHLNIIEVPEFGSSLHSDTLMENILSYVENTFEETFRLECSLDRSNSDDKRIHCCLYFISPFGHSLKPLDILFLKQFQSKVNIIPVIGKCDIFTKKELMRFKSNVLNDFKKHEIDLFEYLNNSESIEDEIDDIKELCDEIKNNIPFAITSSLNTIKTEKRQPEFGREYPWGIVKTENTTISDFCRLKQILTKSHVNYFKKLTKAVHYENFRMKYILDRVK